MTRRIEEMEIPGEGTVFVEVEDRSVLEDMSALDRKEVKRRLQSAFADVTSLIRSLAKGLVREIRELEQEVGPKEFTIEFGVKLDTEVGAVLASSKTGASLMVKLKWEEPESTP